MKISFLASISVAVLFAAALPGAPQDTNLENRIAQLTPDDLKQGDRLFAAHCALCHGIGGTGGRGPNLRVGNLRRVSDDQALFNVIRNGVNGTEMAPSWMLSDNEVWRVTGYIRTLGRVEKEDLSGNADRGKAIYRGQGGCAGCHIVQGQGGNLGPDLTAIGASRGASHLREALLDPGAVTPKGYAVFRATLPDGSTVRGMKVNEDVFTIQLRDAGNRFHSLRKRELKELQDEDKASLMPSYRDTLSESGIEDVVAYLAGLRGKP